MSFSELITTEDTGDTENRAETINGFESTEASYGAAEASLLFICFPL
jgi:hypothetical protein